MNEEVTEYIEKQKSPNKELLKELRNIIFNVAPKITEEMKGGVPAYCTGKESPYGSIYIVSLKDHVNIGFLLSRLSEPEIRLLKGGGKTMRALEIKSFEEINKDLIIKLVKKAAKKEP
jgi:hypothetical protein